MLSGIANLIFGATPLEEETTANKEVNLRVTSIENEWALVDKHENNEHPSMSVYTTRGRPSSTGIESNHSESSDIHELEPTSTAVQPRTWRTPHRPRAVAARAGLITQQVELVKPMQLRQQQLSQKKLSRNKLERNNKVYLQRRHTRNRQLLQQPKSAGKRKC